MSKVMVGQCLFDIAIQDTGTVENVISIALRNNMSVTDVLEVGISVQTPTDIDQVNKQVSNYYRLQGLKPASEDENTILKQGIGFWRIEDDFVVS